MSRYNAYMNAHFSQCRIIARAYDDCRDRAVTIHLIPGQFDCVGVSDGTDAWIAPAAAGPFFRTATGDVADILRRLEAGEPVPPVPDVAPGPKNKRRTLITETCGDPPPRRPRALLVDSGEPVAVNTRRRHVIA